MRMIYVLFVLSFILMTALAIVLKRLQQQQLQYTIVQHQLRESNFALKSAEESHTEIIQSLDCQVQQLLDQILHLQTQYETSAQQLSEATSEIFKLQGLEAENILLKQKLDDLYNDLENEITAKTQPLCERIAELEHINRQLKRDYQILQARDLGLTEGETIVLKVREKDLYPFEKKAILLDVLASCKDNVFPNSRRQHLLKDIVACNDFSSHREWLKTEIQHLFRDYRSMNSQMRAKLEALGFEIISENSSYKMIFQEDHRYMIAVSKTPSDRRAGRNIASDICHTIL
ncbi:MAG TPA: hypothetical protein V6D19_02775 [Stenomitos sp.]